MASSKFKQREVFDPLRGIWAVATSEELVRQTWLHIMIHDLAYPRSLIAIEKQLAELSPMQGRGNLPNRRVDILCFTPTTDGLAPLLLVECKESSPGEGARAQVLGYNAFVQARFVAIAGPDRAELIYPYSVSFLPSYEQLVERG